MVVAAITEKKPEQIARIEDKQLMFVLLKELTLKQAAKTAAEITAGKKNYFYQLGLELQAL